MSDSDVELMEIDEPSQVQPGTSTDNLPNVEDSSKMETEDDDGNESIQQAVEGTIDNMVDQVCEQMELEVIKETTINNLPDQVCINYILYSIILHTCPKERCIYQIYMDS